MAWTVDAAKQGFEQQASRISGWRQSISSA
jgi:hypothetical protein